MKARIDSRSPIVDTEACVREAGGRYDLVMAGAQRLRELKRQAREQNRHVTAIDALLEIQHGQLNIIDYLAKVK